jgi:hypothetical protein
MTWIHREEVEPFLALAYRSGKRATYQSHENCAMWLLNFARTSSRSAHERPVNEATHSAQLPISTTLNPLWNSEVLETLSHPKAVMRRRFKLLQSPRRIARKIGKRLPSLLQWSVYRSAHRVSVPFNGYSSISRLSNEKMVLSPTTITLCPFISRFYTPRKRIT